MRESPRTIVLVDDDPDFLELNRRLLEARGYRVLCFSDSRGALERLQAEPPAAVVADLMMKSLDSGFSLARSIKASPGLAAVPVIIVTAAASQRGFDFSPRGEEDLAAMSADAFFEKPVSPQALVARIEELIS